MNPKTIKAQNEKLKKNLGEDVGKRVRIEEVKKEAEAKAREQEEVAKIYAEVVKEYDALLSSNPMLWGKIYCARHFSKPTAPFHLEIVKELLATDRLAIAAPRESAKSTIVSFLYPSHSIAFKKRRFIIIVQNTFAKAAGSLETIKAEFKENTKILNDFKVKMIKDREGDTIFQHPDGFKTRVLCKGHDQIGSIRGEKFEAYRPDLIIVDDLEDDELVKNPERRVWIKDLFDNALTLSGGVGNLKICVIGTILHDDSQMAKLVSKIEYKEFTKMIFRARRRNGESLWPEKWTLEYLAWLEKEKPETFAKEMQNDPSSGMMEGISRKDFRYWRIENNQAVLFNEVEEVVARWKLSDCKAAVAYDLAWEEKRDSDFAVAFPAFLTPSSDILFDEYFCKRGLRPAEFEETAFSMDVRLEALTGKRVAHGFEKAKLEKVMKWWLGEAMRRRNKFLWLKDLQWDGDKIQRILTRLGNRYAQHSVYHKKGMGDLENQLIRIRSVAHDDIADAAQGVVQLLNYAPTTKKPEEQTNVFDWWKQQTPRWRESHKSNYVFGNRQAPSIIKTVKACP